MARPRYLSRTAVLLALTLCSAAAPQDARSERALERTRFMLEQRPTHPALFDRYFKLLVQANAIDAEVDALRSRLADDPQTSLSVVLGRLLLRAGQEEEALVVLDGIDGGGAEIQAVLGDIYFKLARFDPASRAYAAALSGARTSEQKRVLFEKAGRAELALGHRDAAIATWRRIGELDGGKFFRRLHVAELLSEAGLLDEAEQAYAPLLAETESDAPRHCQVLRDVGRLQELRGDLDRALSTYDEVLALTGRGNWLRREVEKRVVQIYQRTGRLTELVARLEDESAGDLATVELLATVLIGMRELDRAVELLASVSPRFPKDVRLARRLAELHLEREDPEAAIAEYQRIIDERPEELELYFELGTLFAKSERFAEAKNQWEKALAKNLEDPSLCARLASMYALWNRAEDAVRMYRRAIELEPDEVVRRVDLAEYLFAHERRDEAIAVLDSALVRAAGHPRRLEALAPVLRENELLDRAQRAFEEILAAEPGNHEIRYALADLLLGRGDVDGALPLLWEIVDQDDRGGAQRTLAANTLVNLAARTDGGLEELIAAASVRQSAGASFVAGRAHSRNRDFHRAIEAYRAAIERNPSDVESRRLLARLFAEEGDYGAALDAYEALGVVAPSERSQHFREVARLHLERYDLDAAVATWTRAMRDNPDNPAVFLEVGREFLSIQRVPEALEAFRQAARLKPQDPEVLLRLAGALRQAGRHEEAEERLLDVAATALDSRDREQARVELFELYAEQGRIDDRIEALSAAIAENPYDQSAPQLLADLYMRTGDFVLGLEIVDRVVKFQPRNRELLARRAELLEALEEWDEAILVHEELLEFPDADRDLHLSGIGRAQFEMGRASEAKETFRQIKDRGRVRRLYAKYRLHQEAIEHYRRAIARNPADVSSYLYLAQELEKLSARAEAIEVLERVLNLRPYYRQALELVGKLYVQEGRREDAVHAGMRLFGLRGEEVDKDRREEWEDEQQRRASRYYRRPSRQQPFSQRRLQAAQSYFNSRGLKDEWGRIVVAEARRRPADLVLYEAVQQHYRWAEKSAGKFVDFVREILAHDFDELRVPPGYTRRSYREKLETDMIAVWDSDAASAERRIAELSGAERAGEPLSARELIERARARRALGRLETTRADLQRALSLEPGQPVALTLLAEALVEQKEYAAAIPHVEALIAWWEGPGREFEAEVAARGEQTFLRHKKAMRDALPRRIRRRIGDDVLRDVLARVTSGTFDKLESLSFPESVPSRFACAVKLIRLQRAAGDEAGLESAVRTAREIASNIAERSALGSVLFQEQLHDAAEQVLASVIAAADELRDDPLQVYFWDRYAPAVKQAAGPLGELLSRRGQLRDAYRILRENGEAQKAELLLREHADALRPVLEQNVARCADALAAARRDAVRDLSTLELDYRDAIIEHADYYVGEKGFEAAERIYRESLQLLPDDLEVRGVIALLCERRGDYLASIAMHEEMIGVKRRRKRATAGETSIPPTRLQPTLPGATPRNGPVASSMPGPSATYGGRVSYRRGGDRFDIGPDYERILQLYAERNKHDEVLETLRSLMQEDPATFRRMSWSVLDKLRNQDLGKRKLPILRILRGVVKGDDWLTLEYARSCREEGELAEAKRALDKLITKNLGTRSSYVESAELELKRVLQRMGEFEVGVDRLRAAVEAEPDNVRHRLRLARRLQKDHDYEAALAEAEIIVDKAPYLLDAKELVVNTAAAAGRDDVAIAMLRRLYDESTSSSETVSRGVSLANWLYAGGETEQATAIIDQLEIQSGGTSSFSPGNWFLDKDDLRKALGHYRRELERNRTQAWQLDQYRKRVARLELATGDAPSAIRRYLDAIDEAGSLQDREARWKDLLRVVKGHPDPEALAAELREVHSGRETPRDHLVLAAVAFATGEGDAAESELRMAIAKSPKEIYLYPLLLGLRRLHDDHDGALALLDEMSRVYGGSDTMRWISGVALSERDQMKLLRAELLEARGDQQAADALLESIVDETEPATLQRLSQVYRQRQRLDEALSALRRYHARLGTREQSHLVAEAQLMLELGRIDEARELVEAAYVMARGNSQTRNLLVEIHRRVGELPALVARFEEELAKDFRDSGLRSTLLSIHAELGHVEERRRIFERMLEEEDMRDEALDKLADLAAEQGDRARQLEYLERRLPLNAGNRKKSIHREIATLMAKLGDVDGGAEHYLHAIDPDIADGQLSLGRWYQRYERHADAVGAFEKALELDPEHERVALPLIQSAWSIGEHERVVEQIAKLLRADRGRKELLEGKLHTQLCDALSGLSGERRRGVLAGTAGDVASLELACVANLARADFEAALARSDETLANDDGSLVALDVRRRALAELGRVSELPDAIEGLRLAVEREFVISNDWNYYNRAQSLQNDLGRMRHVLGDDDAAERAWRASPVRRTPYSNPFSFWRSDWGIRHAAELWLGVRRPELALKALRREFLIREQAPWSTLTRALDGVGRLDEVEQLAWQRFLDPLELYGIESGSYGWVWVGGEYRQANGMQEFLVEFYRDRNRLGDLTRRAEELLTDPATSRQAKQLRQAIARVTGDHAYLASEQESELAARPYPMSPGQAYELAVMWRQADRPAKALEVMRRCLDFDRATLDRHVLVRRGPASSYYRYGSGGKNGGNPFSFNFDDSYSSWWSSTSRGDLHRHRTFVAALLWRTGDVERAEAVENALLDQSTIRRRQQRLEELATAYRTHGAYPQAARLLRILLGDDRFEIEDEKRDRLLDDLITSLESAGDDEGFREVTRERRRLLEERIASQPGPHAFELRAKIAKLLVEKIGDCAAGLDHLDFILRFEPSDPELRGLRATTLIRMDRFAEGVEELRALSRFRRQHGQDDTLAEQAWLGIGLARSGAADDAKRVLTKVLQRLPKDGELRRLVEDALD